MGKSTFSWLASILGVLGAAITAGYPAWGTVTGVVILFVAGAMAAGTVISQSRSSYAERRAAGQKISPSLVTLSSAAIFAVYAAGFNQTGSAADRFEVQTARRKTAAPIAATLAGPGITSPGAGEFPSIAPADSPARKFSAPAITQNGSEPFSQGGSAEATNEVPGSVSGPALSSAPESPKKHSPSSPTGSPRASVQDFAPIVDLPPPLPAPRFPSPDQNSAVATAHHQQPATPQVTYRDGTYLGLGSCRHGDIQASVVVEGGKITSATITQCLTRYSCSWIADLPAQVVSRQSADVDFVSGATQSSDAFSDAVTAALSHASE